MELHNKRIFLVLHQTAFESIGLVFLQKKYRMVIDLEAKAQDVEHFVE
jgi:hypothetical protein